MEASLAFAHIIPSPSYLQHGLKGQIALPVGSLHNSDFRSDNGYLNKARVNLAKSQRPVP